LVETRGM